jgi:PAP2 superfamily protein
MTPRDVALTIKIALRAWAKSRAGHVTAAGAAVVALMTADVLADGLLTSLDRAIRDATDPGGDPPAWVGPVERLGEVRVSATVLVVVALVSMQVLWRCWPGLLAAAQLAALAIVVGGLKLSVPRSGPDGTQPGEGQLGFFPSGHTATSAICLGTAVFLVMASSSRGRPLARIQRVGFFVGLAVGLVVGGGAVVGGYHWVSDVAASLVISAVVLHVGFTVCRGYVERPSDVPQRV